MNRKAWFFPSLPWFAILFRGPVSESVKQLLSCQSLCWYCVLKRIRFTDQRAPLILTFQTFSSSDFKRRWLGHFYFILFCCTLSFRLSTWFSSECFSLTDNFPRCTASPATPWYLTHNTNTYTCRHIQNSLTLSVSLCPLFSLSLLLYYTHTHISTHAYKAFAICMHQYERSTQARKRKAELDYLGSLWHERPTDKFLSLPPATLLADRKEEVR